MYIYITLLSQRERERENDCFSDFLFNNSFLEEKDILENSTAFDARRDIMRFKGSSN